MSAKWRQIKQQTLPRQFVQIQDRLDELIMGGTGFTFGGLTGETESLKRRSENLVRNAGLDSWTSATALTNWQSAAGSNWDTGTNVNRESTVKWALPYLAKLGDGSNANTGMAQAADFRVTPSQTYCFGMRVEGASANCQYIVILKAYDVNEAEITTGTPLGENWTYDAAYGGFKSDIGTPDTDNFDLVEIQIPLDETIHYLRCSIQYTHTSAPATKYIYVDEVKISRGETTDPFALRPIFDTEGAFGSGLGLYLPLWSAAYGIATQTLTYSALRDRNDATPKYLELLYPNTESAIAYLTGYGVTGTTPGGQLYGRQARNTLASPSASQANDTLLEIGGIGYGQNAWASAPKSAVLFSAAENWSNSAQGTYISLHTTDNTTTTLYERMRITHDGLVGIGATLPIALLEVKGASTNAIIWNEVLRNPYHAATDGHGVGLKLMGDTDADERKYAAIVAVGISGGYFDNVALAFYTPHSATPTEKMRIDDYGNVGVGTSLPSSFVDLEKVGTAKAYTNLLELTNKVNNADMDGTGTAILFNQWYYHVSTPAVHEAGKIAVVTEKDWTGSDISQCSYMGLSTCLEGSLIEWARLTSEGCISLYSNNDNGDRPTPQLYWMSLYTKSSTYAAYDERPWFVGSDGHNRVIPNFDFTAGSGHAFWTAVFLKKEDDSASHSQSTTLMPVTALTTTADDGSGEVHYNGSEIANLSDLPGPYKGSASVTFTDTPGYVDVTTGLGSVAGALCTLDYAMGDGVALTVRINNPSAGKIRIYGKNVSGTGSLGLTVYWFAW